MTCTICGGQSGKEICPLCREAFVRGSLLNMKAKMIFFSEGEMQELLDCFDLATGALVKYDPIFYKEKINKLKALRRKIHETN